jgi:D-sedoheptulose 7-phosphate isomerase
MEMGYSMETTKDQIINDLIDCFKSGHKLLICGNGGSASMSQHMAAEFVGRFEHERKALPAIALTTDTSILTSWPNDYSFDTVFSRQVEALGQRGDVLIGISTSGNSKNVLLAFAEGYGRGLKTIDFPRQGSSTAEIQEFQLKLMHDIVREVEKEFI